MTSYLYVLACPVDFKFFVGTSPRQIKNPISYFNEENKDYSYLFDHPMTEVVTVERTTSDNQVDDKVLELMAQHGALNVRGGSYMTLNSEVIEGLINMDAFRHIRKCLLCLSTSHKSNKCVQYNTDTDSDYVPGQSEDDDDKDDTEESDMDLEEEEDEEDVV